MCRRLQQVTLSICKVVVTSCHFDFLKHKIQRFYIFFLFLEVLKNNKMAGFDIKDELGNVGGQIAQGGISRLVDVVINLATGFVRKKRNGKFTGTQTISRQN